MTDYRQIPEHETTLIHSLINWGINLSGWTFIGLFFLLVWISLPSGMTP